MSSLLKVRRVLPLVRPDLFAAAAAIPAVLEAAAEPTAVDALPADSCAGREAQSAADLRAKRLKSLYQRTLRNEMHSEALTYSGRLSA